MGHSFRRILKRSRASLLGSAALCALAAAHAHAAGPQRAAPVRVAAVETAPASAAREEIVADAVQVSQHGEFTRLTFMLSGVVTPRAFVLAEPNRVIVDLPEVNFQIDPAAGRPPVEPPPKSASRRPAKPARGEAAKPAKPLAGVISSFRFGRFAAGKSRIVVDLAEAARIVRIEAEPDAGGQGVRLVLDLARTDAAAFATAAAEGRKAADGPQQAAAAPAPNNDARPLVVIDPGHGGIDVGAHGASDTQEKAIVFDFAKTLAGRLKSAGHYRILMTRDEDIFVPLSQRVKIARDAGAALFISVHADTLADAAFVSGATVYTVSDKASDAEAARVAESENMADVVGGLDGKEDVSEVSDILFDLTRRETRAFSHVFARTLVGYIKETAKLNKNPQRAAGFRVLKAPDVPSVLLELGYLSSDEDLAQLRNSEWREKAAGSVAKAVDSFFAGRLPAPPAQAAEGAPESADAGVARVIH